MGLGVLITNIILASRTGTELYVRDLAVELLRRGHSPVAYSPVQGVMSEEIQAAGVPVVDDLARLDAPPDVIHGHHLYETMTAVLRFPGVPAIFVCHDYTSWHDSPPIHPRIRRYLGVGGIYRERLIREGVEESRAHVLLNSVDLRRFLPRGPLPDRPRRALVFSNYASATTHLPAAEEACRRAGLELDVAGSGAGRSIDRPEEILGKYDLIFAKGKAALEAAAVGAAVVLCDSGGAGPMVTSDDLDRLRFENFGVRLLREPLQPEALLRQIERYDAKDAARVRDMVRATAGLEMAVDQLLRIYQEVIEEQKTAGHCEGDAEARAAAAFLRRVSLNARQWEVAHALLERSAEEAGVQERESRIKALESDLRAWQERARELDETIKAMQSSLAFRLGKSLAKLPGLGAPLRRFAGRRPPKRTT